MRAGTENMNKKILVKIVDYLMMTACIISIFIELQNGFKIRDRWIIICLVWVIIARSRDYNIRKPQSACPICHSTSSNPQCQYCNGK